MPLASEALSSTERSGWPDGRRRKGLRNNWGGLVAPNILAWKMVCLLLLPPTPAQAPILTELCQFEFSERGLKQIRSVLQLRSKSAHDLRGINQISTANFLIKNPFLQLMLAFYPFLSQKDKRVPIGIQKDHFYANDHFRLALGGLLA